MSKKIGILLTNTGTPDAPTTPSVRQYLREFLSDPRIVHLPRIIWLPILYLLILTTRPKKSAELYKRIWTADGSPMRVHMQNIQRKLAEKLNSNLIEIGMNYGQPSITNSLNKLANSSVDEIVVLPLFPQYSDTTTASTKDRVKTSHPIKFIDHYHDHPEYISALAKQVETTWAARGKQYHLLISFHGIPKRFAAEGDPYPTHCERTAALLAEKLRLSPTQWTLCYQSQFGYDKWLTPSTQTLFIELPKQGIKEIDIICPGFAVDCLETLEEIAISGEESFMEAGGQRFNYIPALNDSEIQITLLKTLTHP